jgi:hypothetical protein
MPELYTPRPIKRNRRSAADMTAIKDAIVDVLREDNPATVRGVFYRVAARGLVAKTEAEYKGTIGRLLVEMRINGEVPWEWISDATRWLHRPPVKQSMEQALQDAAMTYRRDLWRDQNVDVQIWVEKNTIAGILVGEAFPWQVPVYPSIGFSGVGALQAMAREMAATGKPTHIYYFGDFDKAGVDIDRASAARLHQFAPDAEIHFTRVTVLEEQIARWNLPTRPSKATGPRFASEQSVDVDAVPTRILQALVRDCIERHVDPVALRRNQVIEQAERRGMQMFVDAFQAKPPRTEELTPLVERWASTWGADYRFAAACLWVVADRGTPETDSEQWALSALQAIAARYNTEHGSGHGMAAIKTWLFKEAQEQ